MVRNVVEQKDFLKSLAAKSKYYNKRRFLIAEATPKQIKALQEISHNVSKAIVPLSNCQTEKLRRGRYKKFIVAAGSKKGSLESKRKIFVQRGGFLQYILPAALLYLQQYM